ncbi:Sec-independent protein translocase protein TatB [Roseicella sp. DB1501]|uniref:Sec-independent protein translocase protein TatB n=1 Tax=Roseicella sp. DB1501 TaxID=2730925 RepID=UPI00149262D2|nr:Sec-independent protein translocase protein TatB [Roseicella sp. DB1501]NOG73246.1 twin-arginine translocase subunit TatB [Roseicella sp. DB1501]
MFDLAWSEIALIGVVALVVIGPKDLPEAIRGLARGVQKLRRMAGEFQSQADELVREANLEEVRSSINEIRNFNFRDTVERHIDGDGSIRRTFTEDPLKDDPLKTQHAATTAPAEPLSGAPEAAAAAPAVAEPPPPPAVPAFIPPAYAPPAAAPAAQAAAGTPPPAFVPPPSAPPSSAPTGETPAPTHKD